MSTTSRRTFLAASAAFSLGRVRGVAGLRVTDVEAGADGGRILGKNVAHAIHRRARQ